MDKGQQQQQEVRAALAEVERALSVLFGAPAPAGLDREAAHRFLQAFQKTHPLAWPCAVAGLAAALAQPPSPDTITTTTITSSSPPLPLFLAQTLAHRARKGWAAGGLAPVEMEQAAGLLLRSCQQQQQQQQQGGQGASPPQRQQLATQVGLSLCAGVIACPRVAPAAVFGETMGLVERVAAGGGGGGGEGVGAAVLAEARLRLLQLLPEEALRSRSLSVPVERRRAVLRALAVGDESGPPAALSPPPPPAAQALHHLITASQQEQQQPPFPCAQAFAAMSAWLELDYLPWESVLGPWLPRALKTAHMAVGRWAGGGGGGERGEETAAVAAAAAAALDLLAGVVAPSEAGEEGGPAFGPRGGAAAEEEAWRWWQHRRRQGIEAGAAILPFLPHLWSSITTTTAAAPHATTDHHQQHHLDSPVGRAALSLAVAVGMAGLSPPPPPPRAARKGGEQEQGGPAALLLLPPLYRDPSAVLTPLLAAAREAPPATVVLTFEFWQALGDAAIDTDTAAPAAAPAIDAAVLQFVAAVVGRATFPAGFPGALPLGDRQAFEAFREETRDVLRGVVGGGRRRGQAVAAALVQELWRLQALPGPAEAQAFPLESVVHALSALGKELPTLLPTRDLARLVAALPTLPPHPAIVRSGALLLSTLPEWLTGPGEGDEEEEAKGAALHAALRLLLASLAFPESEREPFPLKSKQDHAGVVALLKLSQTGPARLATVPEAADQLVMAAALHSTRQQQGAPPPLEPRSQLLLLEAAARVAVHLPAGTVEVQRQLEALCAPMWAGVAAAVSGGGGGGMEKGEEDEDDAVSRELRALATVVHAAGVGAGTAAAGVGALATCFLARGEGIRSLLAYDGHHHAGWTRGAIALTSSLLRALGRAGVGGGGDAAAACSPALLEAYHHCLQGWAPTALQQIAPTTATGATPLLLLLPSFLGWAEAALLSLLPPTGTPPMSHDASALIAAAWDVYATVARRCVEALLALKHDNNGGNGGGSSSEEAREELAAAFFASLTRCLLPSSSPTSPLLARDPALLPSALSAAAACLDVQGREAGKAVCAFVRHAAGAAAAAASAGGGQGGDELGTTLWRLFVGVGGESGGQRQDDPTASSSSHGMRLMLALLTGVCGAMPSWMLDDLITSLAALFRAFGAETAGGWMAAAIAHPAFPRAHVSEQARTQFLEQIARCVLPPGAGLADPQQLRAFKTAVKAHCGGKKKGTAGMPHR